MGNRKREGERSHMALFSKCIDVLMKNLDLSPHLATSAISVTVALSTRDKERADWI